MHTKPLQHGKVASLSGPLAPRLTRFDVAHAQRPLDPRCRSHDEGGPERSVLLLVGLGTLCACGPHPRACERHRQQVVNRHPRDDGTDEVVIDKVKQLSSKSRAGRGKGVVRRSISFCPADGRVPCSCLVRVLSVCRRHERFVQELFTFITSSQVKSSFVSRCMQIICQPTPLCQPTPGTLCVVPFTANGFDTSHEHFTSPSTNPALQPRRWSHRHPTFYSPWRISCAGIRNPTPMLHRPYAHPPWIASLQKECACAFHGPLRPLAPPLVRLC